MLSKKEDNPTSLAIYDKNTIVAGVNSNTESLKSGKNQHLRIFSLSDDLKEWGETQKLQVFDDVSLLDYQKGAVAIPKAKSFVVANSVSPGVIYSVSADDQSVLFKEEAELEVNSIAAAPDGSAFVYVTDKKLVVVDSVSGKRVFASEAIKGETFSRAAFLKSGAVVAAVSVTSGGVKLVKLHGDKYEEVAFSTYTKMKKVTALTCKDKYIFTAHQDLSMSIFSAESLRLLKTYKDTHDFAITKVTLNDEETLAVSVSVAMTVNVIYIPADGNFGGSKLLEILILTMLILIVSMAYQKIAGTR